MGQYWLYYVTYIHQHDGKVGFGAKFYRNSGPLNSIEEVQRLIDALTRDELNAEPEEGTLPIVPLSWTLVTAQQGEAVGAPGNGQGPS